MSDDKVRAEFEAWYGKRNDGFVPHYFDCEYDWYDAQPCWQAWQASRASLCVELPEEEEHKGVHYDIDYMPTDAVRAALDKAGVKYR